jgi:hypothetical protein
MVTLFSWGYWGWGNATHELVKAVDAAERERGFKPPVFFDIRFHQRVRAEGFRDDAFEQLLGKRRYRWFKRLGNKNIGSDKRAEIKIADPFSAKILLEEAIEYARDKRRVIFFCACPFYRPCHRHTVARLVLDEATRIGRRVQIVEWPGGTVSTQTIQVKGSVFDSVRNGLKNVPFDGPPLPLDKACLPWGSIVNLESDGRSLSILTGPAKFERRWLLPVYEQWDPSRTRIRPHARSEEFRQVHRLQPADNFPLGARESTGLKALTVRQPWADAIVHLGKDVENRSWRTNYKGMVLIHASAKRDRDPHGLLAELMPRPPSQAVLDQLPTGCVIGVADLFDYVRDSESKWASKGQWHWRLRNVRAIRPVPCAGQLGLWTPSAALKRKLPAWVRNC